MKSEQQKISRRRCLLGLTGLVALGVSEQNQERPEVVHTVLPVKELSPAFAGLRVAVLSDLHIQPGFPVERLEPVLALVEKECPDLVCLLGDYAHRRSPNPVRDLEACLSTLAQLRPRIATVAVTGNHDPELAPAPIYRRLKIIALRDGIITLERGGEQFCIAGLDTCFHHPTSPRALGERVARVLALSPPRVARLVLWHEPDTAVFTALMGGGAQISGHTHGGQVVAPGYGPLCLPVGGKKYSQGHFAVDEMPLYVNRGIGMVSPLVRWNCRPEITLLTLQPA